LMPEASVDKDGNAMPRQDDVRTAWELPDIETEPVAVLVQVTSPHPLGLGVTSPVCGHHL